MGTLFNRIVALLSRQTLQLSIYAGLCVFYAASATAQNGDLPGFGETIGGNIGNAMESAMQYKIEKGRLNALIADTRRAWQKCNLKCRQYEQLDKKLGDLLAEKDYFFMIKDISGRAASFGNNDPMGLDPFAGRNPAIDALDKLTGGQIDGGIPSKCKVRFVGWSGCIYSKTGSSERGIFDPSKFMSAFGQCKKTYEHYRKCRDEVEYSALPSYQEKLRRHREAMARPEAYKLVKSKPRDVYRAVNVIVNSHPKFYDRQRRQHSDLFPQERELVSGEPYITGRNPKTLKITYRYLEDPQLQGISAPDKEQVLVCTYHNNPEGFKRDGWYAKGDSKTVYYWHKVRPGQVENAQWRQKLLPGHPILFIREAKAECPVAYIPSEPEYLAGMLREGELR